MWLSFCMRICIHKLCYPEAADTVDRTHPPGPKEVELCFPDLSSRPQGICVNRLLEQRMTTRSCSENSHPVAEQDHTLWAPSVHLSAGRLAVAAPQDHAEPRSQVWLTAPMGTQGAISSSVLGLAPGTQCLGCSHTQWMSAKEMTTFTLSKAGPGLAPQHHTVSAGEAAQGKPEWEWIEEGLEGNSPDS